MAIGSCGHLEGSEVFVHDALHSHYTGLVHGCKHALAGTLRTLGMDVLVCVAL